MPRRREEKKSGLGNNLKNENAFARVLRKKGDGKRETATKRKVEKDVNEKRRRSARLRGGKIEDAPILVEVGKKKRKREKVEDSLEQVDSKMRKNVEEEPKRRKKVKKWRKEEQPVQVFRIHVGAGGEDQLREHLRGEGESVMQVLQEETLPDIFSSELVSGLDLEGSSRDFVDEGHRCSVLCPVGCQGHLRRNEVVIFSGWRQGAREVSRTRVKARLVVLKPGDLENDKSSRPVVKLHMNKFKRIGRRKHQVDEVRRAQVERRRLQEQSQTAPPVQPIIPPAPKVLGPRLPQRLAALLTSPPVSREEALAHAWNPEDRSPNVELKADDLFTMRRRPVAQSTDCVRTKMGFTSGTHLFKITWPSRQRGTHAMVGVGTLAAELQADGYKGLVGDSVNSWGWDLGRKQALHAGRDSVGAPLFPTSLTHHHQWIVPDQFLMILDMDAGTLAWFADHQYLGVSHHGIQGEVFPMVSTVWGHCEVSLVYLGSSPPNLVHPLKTLAKVEVLRALDSLSPTSFSSVQDRQHLLAKLDHHIGPQIPVTLRHFLASTS